LFSILFIAQERRFYAPSVAEIFNIFFRILFFGIALSTGLGFDDSIGVVA
jgi:hypothetical protein